MTPRYTPSKMLQRYSVRLRIYSWFMKYCHPKIGVCGRHHCFPDSDVGRRQQCVYACACANTIYYLHLYNHQCYSSSHHASERAEEATRVPKTLAAFLAPSSSRLPLPRNGLLVEENCQLAINDVRLHLQPTQDRSAPSF